MKIAILGGGNMGGATALGLVNAGKVDPEDITVTALHKATLDKFASAGMKVSLSNADAVKGADIIIIAVKPWIVETVVSEIRPVIDYSSQMIVSMAAGVDADVLLGWLGTDRAGLSPKLLSVIPNTAIEIRRSMTFIWPVKADTGAVNIVEDLFASVGATMVVNKRQLDAGMAMASCGIAYAMRYIHASAEGGVELGLYPKDAIRIACETVSGAAALLTAHGSHPESEIDKVTTPGGITIKGLNEMEHSGFTSAVIKGLKASVSHS